MRPLIFVGLLVLGVMLSVFVAIVAFIPVWLGAIVWWQLTKPEEGHG